MEPEQGIPRYVTVEREAHSDFMVRRGLALMVNHGFAATPGGQKDFMYKVATIAGHVQPHAAVSSCTRTILATIPGLVRAISG